MAVNIATRMQSDPRTATAAPSPAPAPTYTRTPAPSLNRTTRRPTSRTYRR